ncbi:MAG: GNAT family N-acetyltransferase [Clostridiales bacterium]|nr:GNAT family N-acetyltransferase [Clostridiales bacterium]
MNIIIKEFDRKDIKQAVEIWNEVVDEGLAFPQLEDLTEKTGIEFFEGQSFTGLAFDADTGEAVGIYILHPNNVGRCGHLCNASYAVKSSHRGRGIGEELVCHCIKTAPKKGFKILQFNAVVATNTAALGLYKKLGFTPLGVIPEGFLLKNGTYEDIIPHYITL